MARALDPVDDGEQDLAIGFTELFDDGGRLRLLGRTRDDLIGVDSRRLAPCGFEVFVNRIPIEAGRRVPPPFNYVRDAPDHRDAVR